MEEEDGGISQDKVMGRGESEGENPRKYSKKRRMKEDMIGGFRKYNNEGSMEGKRIERKVEEQHEGGKEERTATIASECSRVLCVCCFMENIVPVA